MGPEVDPARVEQLEQQLQEVLRRLEGHDAELAQLRGAGGRSAEPELAVAAPGGEEGARKQEASQRDLEMERLSKEMEMSAFHEVKANVWDSALFIGTPAVGHVGSACMLLVLAVNVIGQIMFISVVATSPNNFVNSSPPNVYDILEWRTTVAHQADSVVGGHSLASRVCQRDPGLAVAGMQVGFIKDQIAYSSVLDVIGVPAGPLLCVFVLLLWVLTILVDVGETANFMLAVSVLPRDRHTHLQLSGEGIAVRTVTLWRYALLMLMSCLRLLIAVLLLYDGAKWLAATMNLESLVLNAAALSFVLDFDELLFGTLGLPLAKTLVGKCQPLPLPRHRHWRGIGVRPVLFGVACLVLVLTLRYTDVEETRSHLQELNTTLCGGDQDFVYEIQASNGLLSFASTTPWQPRESAHWYGQQQVVHEFIHRHETPMVSDSFTLAESLSELQWFGRLTPTEFANQLPCQDDPARVRKFLPLLRVASGNLTAESCADLREHCRDWYSAALRSICPVTCGCNSPRSGLANFRGCPAACISEDPYKLELQSINCTDMPAAEAASHPGWQLLRRYHAVDNCSQVSHVSCLPASTTYDGTFRLFCPISCGCGGGGTECPPRCSQCAACG